MQLKLQDGNKQASRVLLSQFVKKIQNENDQIDEIMNEKCEEIETIKSKINQIKQEDRQHFQNTNLSIHTDEMKLIQLEKRVVLLQQQNDDFQIIVKQNNEQILQQEIVIQELTRDDGKSEKQLEELKNEHMRQNQGHLDYIKQNIKQFNEQIAILQQQNDQKSIDISQFQEQISTYQLENQTITQELLNFDNEIKQKDIEIQNLHFTLKDTKFQLQQVTEDLADAQLGMVDIQQLQKSNRILQMNNRQAVNQIKFLSENYLTLKADLKVVREKIMDFNLVNQISVVSESLTYLQQKYENKFNQEIQDKKLVKIEQQKNQITSTQQFKNMLIEIKAIKFEINNLHNISLNSTLQIQQLDIEKIISQFILQENTQKHDLLQLKQQISLISQDELPSLRSQLIEQQQICTDKCNNISIQVMDATQKYKFNMQPMLNVIDKFDLDIASNLEMKLNCIQQKIYSLNQKIDNNKEQYLHIHDVVNIINNVVTQQLDTNNIRSIDSNQISQINQINNRLDTINSQFSYIQDFISHSKQKPCEQQEIDPYEPKYFEIKTLLQKLQEVKHKTDQDNLSKIKDLTQQIIELKQQLETKDQSDQQIQTVVENNQDQETIQSENHQLQAKIVALNQELDQLFEEKNQIIQAQTSIQVHSLPDYSQTSDFIAFYSTFHIEPDTVLLSPQELDSSRIDILKNLKLKRLLKKSTINMFTQAYKELNFLFTDPQVAEAIGAQFRITFSAQTDWFSALKNFIVSKFNVAMERFLSIYVEDIFLATSPAYLGVIKVDDRNQFFMIFNILLQFILNGYEISNYNAGTGKTLVFPQLTKSGQKTISALQIKNEELGL